MKKIIGTFFLAMLLADVVIITAFGPVMLPVAKRACQIIDQLKE